MRAHVLAGLIILLAPACGGDELPEEEGLPYLFNFRVWRYDGGRADFRACLYRYHWCEEAGTVQVEQAGERVTLETVSSDEATWYDSSLARTRVDEPFVFTWSGAGEQSALTADVSPAEPFSFRSPRLGATVSAASPLVLEWTPGSDDGLMAWGFRARCPDLPSPLESFAHLVPDSGSVEMPDERISFYPGCSVELWLERLRRGASGGRLVDITSSHSTYVEVSVAP